MNFFVSLHKKKTMNTHKTYVAYDATGVLDHENSTLRTFQQLHAWQRMHLGDKSVEENWAMLPNKIRKYIGRDSARMCHIPLTQDKLERALGTFSVGAQTYPWNSTTIF